MNIVFNIKVENLVRHRTNRNYDNFRADNVRK